MSPSSPFSLDHLPPSEQLCYVHCNFCDTVLAVRVPCSCLSKTVAVRCGHCTGLLSVNMRGLPLPAANQLSFNHSLLSTSHNLLEETPTLPQSSLINQSNPIETVMSTLRVDESPKAPPVNGRIVGIDKKRYYKKIPFMASLQVTNATNVCLFHGAFAGST